MTPHSQRSIKKRWVNQAEPLLTAAVFTKSIFCQSCQPTSRSQSSLGDRKKNLCSSNVRKKCSCLHELWLIFFTGGKAVNLLERKKKKLKVLLLLWTLESSFWKIYFFFVMDHKFFFIGKKMLISGRSEIPPHFRPSENNNALSQLWQKKATYFLWLHYTKVTSKDITNNPSNGNIRWKQSFSTEQVEILMSTMVLNHSHLQIKTQQIHESMRQLFQLSGTEGEEVFLWSCWKGMEVEAKYNHPVWNVAVALGTKTFRFTALLEFCVSQSMWSCQ